jgi:predicted ATPase
MASLAALVDATASGNGRLVAIEGSAGVGKTSLLGEERTKASEGPGFTPGPSRKTLAC